MGIIDTYSWLKEHYKEPEKICVNFQQYIPLSPSDIYRFLISRGMYRPLSNGEIELEVLYKKKIWEELKREYRELRRWLNGPDVPVFILPSDSYNKYIQREYNGKAGLAFSTCIFLFVSVQNSVEEIKAVLTHEYHHVSRLDILDEGEDEYTLLDTIVLEGLAEAAVAERHKEAYHASWVKYYTKKEAVYFWNRFLVPYQDVKKGTKKHDELLSGMNFYPEMLGYCVGYHIVQDCMEHTKFKTAKLLSMKAQDVLKYAKSFAALS
jgi:uncharacterized protein YjaZ